MKKTLAEFKKFILRGNVVDMAVGVIIGGAFQSIVKSMIDDLIMPFVGLATGGVSFVDQFVVLKLAKDVAPGTTYLSLAEAKAAGATVFAYGSFVTAVLNFLIMAIVIFTLVKTINKLHELGQKKEEAAPAAPTTKVCPFCKSTIALDATRCPHCTSQLEETK